MDAATALASVKTIQGLFLSLASLALTDYRYPVASSLTSDISCDHIVIGAGTAGSVVANRLSEDSSNIVCLFEAGGNPGLESVLTGLFPVIPLSRTDFNRSSVNDNYSCQYLQDGVVGLTCGKGLGGSGLLHHVIHVRGAPSDFDPWAEAVGDDSWNFDGLLEYFKKSENLKDSAILNSAYSSYHGTNGYMELTRQSSSENAGILNATAELGHNTILDINANETLGYLEPLLYISTQGYRQSSADGYLTSALNRSNLLVFTETTVEKIIFNGTTATGVQVVTSDGSVVTVNANKEIILSAGAIHSPQLLMLSGIGNQTHLESFDIPVVADVPVGKNYQDHVAAFMMYTLEDSTTTPVSNYHEFPVPMTTGYVALNKTEGSAPDYQTINLIFPYNSSGLLELCTNVFKYKNEVCQTFYEAGNGKKTVAVILNILHPVSTGQILLNSTDINDQPLVYTNMLSNNDDLVLLAKSMADFDQIRDTTYFKSIGSEFVDLGLPECVDYTFGTDAYWQCYALQMSSTMWHYLGTCSMGQVVDAELKVLNVSGLRVVDASVIPTNLSGNINGAVLALAEKAADMIKKTWNM